MAKEQENIIKKMEELVKENENKYNSSNREKVAKADEIYNSLISKGVIKKRGYTLRGIEDFHRLRVRPNK